ncbi:PadR family transcriptional regulator [Bacillus wiedmannii]|nr:PadR family transcriptional regulator [Bacillus wiedmannii]
MSNRRYNEKIVDISLEIADIFEKSLIYFSEY